MKTIWLEKEELFPFVVKQLRDVDIVLDIGCGIMPQPYITPKVHICCEPFKQYIDVLQERLKEQTDRNYVILNSTWAEAVKLFPPNSVDTVFLVDVVEHLKKEEGMHLLKETESIARQQIVLFTPLGFMPQEHPDGKDAWNLDGGAWQEHISGWSPEDFDESWSIYVCKDYHDTDNTGKRLEPPFGAFWAIWDAPKHEKNIDKAFQNTTKSLWINFQELQLQQQHLSQNYQALQKDHQALQQTRAVVLARKLEEYPCLLKLSTSVYVFLLKIYNVLRGK